MSRGRKVVPETRRRVFERDEWRCWNCGFQVPESNRTWPYRAPRGDQRAMTIDHIIPVSRGGTNHASNLRAACWLCNHTRGDDRLHLPFPAPVVDERGETVYDKWGRWKTMRITLGEVARGLTAEQRGASVALSQNLPTEGTEDPMKSTAR